MYPSDAICDTNRDRSLAPSFHDGKTACHHGSSPKCQANSKRINPGLARKSKHQDSEDAGLDDLPWRSQAGRLPPQIVWQGQ